MKQINIRLEIPADYNEVERMVRDTFWEQMLNKEQVICDEHYLVHLIRQSEAFIPELDFVAEIDGKIVGHIIYTKAKVIDEKGHEHSVITFGPLSVHPDYQGQSIARQLMDHSFKAAKELGHKAILIFGHSDYYPRIGFLRAGNYGLTAPDGSVFDAFMAYPLVEGALDELSGKYYTDPVFEVSQEETLAYDKNFPKKTAYKKIPFERLLEQLPSVTQEALKSLEFTYVNEMPFISEDELSQLPGMTAEQVQLVKNIVRDLGIPWGK